MLIFLEMLESDEDRLSFQRIYERNYMKMYYAALNMSGDKHMAEDAVHEAFLKLAEKYSDYASYSDERMTGMCVVMAKQKLIDMYRKDEKLELVDIYDYEEEFVAEEIVIDSIILNEEIETLKGAIEKLTGTSKNVLELKYYQELSNSEIAETLGISKKYVEVRLNRAKGALRKVVEKEEL